VVGGWVPSPRNESPAPGHHVSPTRGRKIQFLKNEVLTLARKFPVRCARGSEEIGVVENTLEKFGIVREFGLACPAPDANDIQAPT
jgi:hypothetical protein